MNPLVPDWNTLDEWVASINSMFGCVENLYVGCFDADTEMEPPFITHLPANDMNFCFPFQEITALRCKTETECELKLIEAIENYIDNDLTEPKDTSKATLVWRIGPDIHQDIAESWPGEANTKGLWYGYSRLKVLDHDSLLSSY